MSRVKAPSEKPEECQSCGFKTSALKGYPDMRGYPNHEQNEDKWLCKLCAGTSAGNVLSYPEQYMESGEVLKAVCYVGNVILRAIEEKGLRTSGPPL